MNSMEGVLWKWTNYWNGWQPRWFVLDKGIITYYRSQEEVNQGCKGSLKVAACDIVPHPTDPKRLDLVIPSEQHYCLKASSEQERQRWVVALGSCKQAAFNSNSATTSSNASSSDNKWKIKRSELRLYCDLLMQQVHTIKTLHLSTEPADVERMSEAASLLGPTCDTVCRVLDECMKTAQASVFTYELPHQEIRDAAISAVPSGDHANRVVVPLTTRQQRVRKTSRSSTLSELETSALPLSPLSIAEKPFERSDSLPCTVTTTTTNTTLNDQAVSDQPSSTAVTMSASQETFEACRQVNTFFSNLPNSFVDVKITPEEGIISEQFLLCCESLLPVFDAMGGATMSPIKADIQGNVNKLRAHSTTHSDTFQDLVNREIVAGTTRSGGSATDALLWLCRGMHFVCRFLEELVATRRVTDAASNAYSATLRQHHNFLVRPVFALCLRALPAFDDFVSALAPSEYDGTHPEYVTILQEDAGEYAKALGALIECVREFYKEKGLDEI